MIVAAGIKVVYNVLFEVFGSTNSVAWIVGYTSIDYVVYSAFFMFLAMLLKNYVADVDLHGKYQVPNWTVEHHKAIVVLMHVSGTYFMAHSLIELSYLFDTMEVYKTGMNHGYISFTHSASILLSVPIYLLFLWHKTTYRPHTWI